MSITKIIPLVLLFSFLGANSFAANLSVSFLDESGSSVNTEFDAILAAYNKANEASKSAKKIPIIEKITKMSNKPYWEKHVKSAMDAGYFSSRDIVWIMKLNEGEDQKALLVVIKNIASNNKRSEKLKNLLLILDIPVKMGSSFYYWSNGEEHKLNVISYAIYFGKQEIVDTLFSAYPGLITDGLTISASSQPSKNEQGDDIEKITDMASWLESGVTLENEYKTTSAIKIMETLVQSVNTPISVAIKSLALELFKRDKLPKELTLNITGR